MASLAQAIQGLQNGRLSPREFFVQVDAAIADDESVTAQLRDLLSEEHTRVMLPPDVITELQRRIAHLTISKAGPGDLQLQTRPGGHAHPPEASGGFLPYRPDQSGRIKGVGDTLNNRFVLEECIGFGGMGTVYKALDLRKLEASDRKPYIAIKVLNAQFSAHPQSLIALQREAKKAQTLAHPNIVTVYDFDRDGPMVYLTMEYLAGEPLSRLLRSPDFTGMPVDKALHIVGGIARALAYAHERGFVHCDLKPANVFVTHRGDVKVIDFGIARVFRKPDEDSEATVFDAGSLGGLTPAYASPEMIEHLVPDPRDDLYALACITYELLTGKHPFNRLAATQARSQGMKPERPEGLSNRQWRALRMALCFDRAQRTPTVMRFYEDMTRKRSPMLAVGIGGAAVAVGVAIAAGALYLRQQGRAPAPPSAAVTASNPPTAPAPAPVAPAPAVPPPSLDAVVPVLARVPCSALTAKLDDRTVRVSGYLASTVGPDGLRKALEAIPGVASVQFDGEAVSQDKCGAMRVFGPYWRSSRQGGATVAMHMKQGGTALKEGDPLIVDIRTGGADSFVHVDYFSLDGNVAHLVPNPRARANQAPANYSATVGGLGNWVISPPFGTEMLVLFTTPVQVSDKIRPAVEQGEGYLQAVEKQLQGIAAKHGADRIGVDFVQITTRAKKN